MTVTPGSRSRRIDPLHYELDPARPEDLAALLKELRAAGDEPWAGVLYAWGLDAANGPAPTGSGPEGTGPFPLPAAREEAVRPAPLLVRELAGEGLPGAPRLVLLTRGAQRVTERDGAPDPVQALLWGAAAWPRPGPTCPARCWWTSTRTRRGTTPPGCWTCCCARPGSPRPRCAVRSGTPRSGCRRTPPTAPNPLGSGGRSTPSWTPTSGCWRSGPACWRA